MKTTAEQITEILNEKSKRAEAATPGPLFPVKEFYGQVRVNSGCPFGSTVAQMDLDPESGTAADNAVFFAAARTDVPALIEVVRIAVEALDKISTHLPAEEAFTAQRANAKILASLKGEHP